MEAQVPLPLKTHNQKVVLKPDPWPRVQQKGLLAEGAQKRSVTHLCTHMALRAGEAPGAEQRSSPCESPALLSPSAVRFLLSQVTPNPVQGAHLVLLLPHSSRT